MLRNFVEPSSALLLVLEFDISGLIHRVLEDPTPKLMGMEGMLSLAQFLTVEDNVMRWEWGIRAKHSAQHLAGEQMLLVFVLRCPLDLTPSGYTSSDSLRNIQLGAERGWLSCLDTLLPLGRTF